MDSFLSASRLLIWQISSAVRNCLFFFFFFPFPWLGQAWRKWTVVEVWKWWVEMVPERVKWRSFFNLAITVVGDAGTDWDLALSTFLSALLRFSFLLFLSLSLFSKRMTKVETFPPPHHLWIRFVLLFWLLFLLFLFLLLFCSCFCSWCCCFWYGRFCCFCCWCFYCCSCCWSITPSGCSCCVSYVVLARSVGYRVGLSSTFTRSAMQISASAAAVVVLGCGVTFLQCHAFNMFTEAPQK